MPKQKQNAASQTQPLSQQFLEKYVAPKKPKGQVTCFLQDKYKDREPFIQVMFYNPQDSDMIRVPNSFGEYRVRVKVAEKRDQEMVELWISQSKQAAAADKAA